MLWALGIVAVASFGFHIGYSSEAITPTNKEAYYVFEKHPACQLYGDPPPYYGVFSAPV
jgi:hypothetical protein